jgi:hypothetical protein
MSVSANLSVPAVLALLAAAAAGAQEPAPSMQCDDGWRGRRDRGAHFCEIRELTLPAADLLSVDGGQNGGVHVTGWDRDEVLVRAMVQVWGDDEEAARDLASEIVVHTDEVIRAEGPEHSGRNWRDGWSVSYEIFAPRNTNLELETHNGGITIANVRGTLDFDATNGGIQLDGVGGDVHGRTTNGGVEVTLTGETWDGDGLDVRTTNGGIRLRVPEDYSARLETGTVNGGVDIDFPVTVQGRIGREITTTLGDGGPLVRAETTNGGVRVSRY